MTDSGSVLGRTCGPGFILTRRTPRLQPCSLQEQRGFSLLEILTAFVIISLVVTALFRLFSGALANVSAAEDWSRALAVAESRLEEAAHATTLREGTTTGTEDDGKIAWTARVSLYTPPDVTPELERASEPLLSRLYRISVDVRFPGVDGRERVLALASVKIGPREVR